MAKGQKTGGRRRGVPNKATWIKDQLFDRCTTEMIDELASGDTKLFWDVLCKLMPKHVQADVGGVGSLGAECDAALIRAGLDGKFKTELGDV